MAKAKSSASVRKSLDRLAVIDAKCKSLYQERDELESALIEKIRSSPANKIPLPGGDTLRLKDNFLDRDGKLRNVAFKTAAVKRFELEIC